MPNPSVILLEKMKVQAEAYIKNTFSGVAQTEELYRLYKNYKELEGKLIYSNPEKENKLLLQKLELEKENKKLIKEISGLKAIQSARSAPVSALVATTEEGQGVIPQKQAEAKLKRLEQENITLKSRLAKLNQKYLEAIVLEKHKPIRLSYRKLSKLYLEVQKRDNFKCQVCGKGAFEIPHHIVYKSRGGDDCADNLILLCGHCHTDAHSSSNKNLEGHLSEAQKAYVEKKRKENEVREVMWRNLD